MKCTNCGAELAENDNFCPECGTPKAGTTITTDVLDENTETVTTMMPVAPVSPKKPAGLAKWLMLLIVGLLALLIAYKQFSPSVERAEAAARENRLDDAVEILESLKGERADGLRAYVNYQMFVSRLQELIDTAIQNGSGLEDFDLWLENGESLWAGVVEGAPQLDPVFYSMAEHNHQVQVALAEIPYQMETARRDMDTMVRGVEYVLELMKKGLDEEEYSFKWGEMKTRMEECRQAGEQLAPIIESYTPITIELDYANVDVEIGGEENCGTDPDGTVDRLGQIYYYTDSLYRSSVTAYRESDDKGKDFSDNARIYYNNSTGTEYRYSSLSFFSMGIDEDMDETLNALREQAFIHYMDQFQFAQS